MPQRAWSAKRERQYEHIKDGLLDRGRTRTPPRRSRQEPSTRNVRGQARPGSRVRRRRTTSRRAGAVGCGRIVGRAAAPCAALQRGQGEEREGPFQDDQGPTRTSRRSVVAAAECHRGRVRRLTGAEARRIAVRRAAARRRTSDRPARRRRRRRSSSSTPRRPVAAECRPGGLEQARRDVPVDRPDVRRSSSSGDPQPECSSDEKNSSAVLVLVCCSASVGMPLAARKSRA